MIYVWDTNILLHVVRNEDYLENLNKKYDFLNPLNDVYISVVSIGEIYSLALSNRWGQKKMQRLEKQIEKVKTIPINNDPSIIKLYSEIDVFSKNQHPALKMSGSARKMGKNDLWIAATTAIYNGTLLSTDNDFSHLEGLFLYFDKIEM